MRRVISAAILLAVAGCDADAVTVQTRAFEHPSDVAFVCFDLSPEGTDVMAVPLDNCADEDDARFALHALVTQKGRGEVAAVDLAEDEVLDSDERVPGFTFVPVGELPVDVVVPRADPTRTYVADLGSMDVRVVQTRQFRSRVSATEPVGIASIPMPVAPTDLALSPDEQTLVVALPDAGAIATIDLGAISDETAPPPQIVMLGMDVPAGVAAEPPETPYCKVCPSDRVGGALVPCNETATGFPGTRETPEPFPPRAPVFAGMTPRPAHMVVVPGTPPRLLVADRALPIVHVVNLDDPSVAEPPIVVGVPTERLAITPLVPATIDATEATERFLYAIDATDGSVIAIRYDEATPANSAVLPASVRGDDDRVGLSAPARTIEVITPAYDPAAPALCDAADADVGPLRLRGVFLAAGLLDGSVAIVDVYDLDARCRGGLLCEDPANADDQQVFIQRHRPRIGTTVTEGISLVTTPTVTANGTSYPVESDGETEGEIAPNLIGLTCAPGQAQVYPFDGEAPLVCALADPWGARPETWTASWQGAIPGAQGGRARLSLEEGTPTVTVETAVCERGVLGAENIAALPSEAPEAAYQPDLFVITGEVPPSVPEDAACRSAIETEEGSVTLDFPIVRSERVVDGDGEHVLVVQDRTRAELGAVTFAQALECFPELVSWEVRVQGAYTVVGSRTAYQERGVANEATGLCTVDASLPPERVGRAVPNTVFDNGIVRFEITGGLAREDEAQLSFEIGQVPGELVIAIGDRLPTVLSHIAFNSANDRMYVVDTQFSGLVEVELEPVVRILSSFD